MWWWSTRSIGLGQAGALTLFLWFVFGGLAAARSGGCPLQFGREPTTESASSMFFVKPVPKFICSIVEQRPPRTVAYCPNAFVAVAECAPDWGLIEASLLTWNL